MHRSLALLAALPVAAALLCTSPPAHARRVKIKIATLAPEGSSWSKVMNEWATAVKKESGGSIRFKLYETGVMGDESDVIRKMRIGQVHAGLFTGNGLGQGLEEIRVLETPMLFNHGATDEVDYVWSKMGDKFREGLEKKGYVLLGDLAETGFVHFFTTRPVRTRGDLKDIKMWVWQGDRFAETEYTGMGVTKLTPLAVPDVLTSLQTGLIEGVYAPPYAAVAMQWQTRTKYFTKGSFIYATGGVMMTKKMWDKLDAKQQRVLSRTATTYSHKLRDVTRRENVRARKALLQAGLEEVAIKPEDAAALREQAAEVRRKMAPEFFPLELLDEVEGHLKEYRSRSN